MRKEKNVPSVQKYNGNALNKLTIINNGEANIDIKDAQLSNPTTIRRIEKSIICKLPPTMNANRPKTASSSPSIVTCQQHSKEKLMRNINGFRESIKVTSASTLHDILTCFDFSAYDMKRIM